MVVKKEGIQVAATITGRNGELLVDQRTTDYDERYKFTGKEKDTESGHTHFSARFLWNDIGIWLSVEGIYENWLMNEVKAWQLEFILDPLSVMNVMPRVKTIIDITPDELQNVEFNGYKPYSREAYEGK